MARGFKHVFSFCFSLLYFLHFSIFFFSFRPSGTRVVYLFFRVSHYFFHVRRTPPPVGPVLTWGTRVATTTATLALADVRVASMTSYAPDRNVPTQTANQRHAGRSIYLCEFAARRQRRHRKYIYTFFSLVFAWLVPLGCHSRLNYLEFHR